MPTTPRPHFIRGHFVMLDYHVADRLGLSTKQLNQLVRRHPAHFPADFAFRLTAEELAWLRTHTEYVNLLYRCPHNRPRAFTDRGILMAALLLHARGGADTAVACLRGLVPSLGEKGSLSRGC